MLDAYRSSFKWRWLSFKTRYTKQCLWSGLPWFLRIDWQWAWTNATTWPLSYNSYSIALIEGCTSPKRREGGSLILRCQGGRRRPEATDALVIQLTPCCQSVLAAGKSRGFGNILGSTPIPLMWRKWEIERKVRWFLRKVLSCYGFFYIGSVILKWSFVWNWFDGSSSLWVPLFLGARLTPFLSILRRDLFGTSVECLVYFVSIRWW